MSYDQVAYWRERGRTYEAGFRRTPEFVAQEFAIISLVRDLAPRSILDVGCGFGRIAALLPEAEYTGIDISPEMLTSAKAKVPDGEFIESTLLDFRPDRRWDLVMAIEYLMHVPPDRVRADVASLRRLSNRHVLTLDWSVPIQRTVLPHNFLHDYRDLLGPRARIRIVGQQSLCHWERAQ